ncbi:MAG: hypothetical protein HDS14_03035 [Bacteroides sp.]|nr:hypothetical protein [Bacteroides sp.]
MANNKYFAILNGEQTIFVEITTERADIIIHQYEGDEAWYLADVLSEELGFSIHNVQWSIVSPDKIKYVGEPLNVSHAIPPRVFYIQHHTYDEYEGPSGTDDIIGAFPTWDEALQSIKEWDYKDLDHEICYPKVNEDEGIGKYYDGYYHHILQIRQMEI